MQKTAVTKTCAICGSIYEVKTYRANISRFCSRECWSHRRKPFYKVCKTCGKVFDTIDHRAKFCSRDCLLSWKTVDTSPLWKGGNSLKRERAQASGELTKWRKSVYNRDNYTCQICKEPQGDKALDVHHIDYNKKNCNPENLIALCMSCHRKTNYNRYFWKSYLQNSGRYDAP